MAVLTSAQLIGQPYTVTAAVITTAGGATPTGTLSLISGTTTVASVNLATATPGSNGYYALTAASGLVAGRDVFHGL